MVIQRDRWTDTEEGKQKDRKEIFLHCTFNKTRYVSV